MAFCLCYVVVFGIDYGSLGMPLVLYKNIRREEMRRAFILWVSTIVILIVMLLVVSSGQQIESVGESPMRSHLVGRKVAIKYDGWTNKERGIVRDVVGDWVILGYKEGKNYEKWVNLSRAFSIEVGLARDN